MILSAALPSVMRLTPASSYRREVAKRMFASHSGDDGCLALILGKPGGGKGTISGKILSDFQEFSHLSTGDVLRKHVREGTNIGIEAKTYMDAGNLVPDDLIIKLVLEDASASLKQGNSLLLDGFPRTLEQAKSLEKSIDVDLVINLDIPTDTIVERISDRWIHPASGRIYSYSYRPPRVVGKDDITGEDLVQREDDKPETVRKRLDAYTKVTQPLVDYYDQQGILNTFQGTKSDVIYVDVRHWLEDKLHSHEHSQDDSMYSSISFS